MVGRQVLLVESKQTRANKLVEMLNRLRFEVTTATDGINALSQIESQEPNLILCNRDITGHTARELCELVKDFGTGTVPFVLLVPATASEPEKTSREIGADASLVYPVEFNQLANLTRILISNSDLQNHVTHLKEENRELRNALSQKALIDPETRFYRFDLFRQVILLEIKRAKRYEFPVSILLIAFDNFQKIAGWLTPNQRTSLYAVIRQAVVFAIRDIDIPLLFAEEKVLVVMPHTDLAGSATVADRIRDKITSIKPPDSLAQLEISLSIAVASTENRSETSFGAMIKESMNGLKEAAIKGGNLVMLCRSPGDDSNTKTCNDSAGKLGPRMFFV